MTSARVAIAVTIAICAGAIRASAYDVGSHEKLTVQSARASVLANAKFLRSLGIGPHEQFFSVEGPLDAVGQMAMGSRREDTEGILPALPLLPDVLEYQYRKGNHFFDPANGGRGMTPCYPFFVPTLCRPAPTWALEEQGGDFQNFSLSDARQRFLEALTSSDSAVREGSHGLLFRTLGQVMHLIQDMAQPQHARKDFHLVAPTNRYETDTENNYGTGDETYGPIYGVDPENQAGTTPLSIEIPRDLWERPDGGGIAQFANLNFVTFQTDFVGPSVVGTVDGQLVVSADTHPEFPSPSASPAELAAYTWDQLQIEDPQPAATSPLFEPPLDGRIYFVRTPVHDAITDQTVPNFTSTLSIYDYDFKFYGLDPCPLPDGELCREASFSQNRFNFRFARDLLLPRAISYGTTLINYFFRGVWRDGHPALRLSSAASEGGFLNIGNGSGQLLHGGQLVLYYDDQDGSRKLLTQAAGTIDAGGTITVGTSADWDTLGQNMEPGGQVVLAYTGQVGEDPRGISAAGRVCDCGKTGVLSDVEPDADCKAVCPCQYLAFEEGDPGIPNDGVTVIPTPPVFSCVFGNCRWSRQSLKLAEPLPLGEYPKGLTVTFFAADGRTDLRTVLGFHGASTASCSFCQMPSSGSGPSESTFVATQENGVNGIAVPYSSDDVETITSGSCSCGGGTSFPIDDFWKLEFCYGASPLDCASTAVPIDAIRVCPGVP